jgi:hypothetical protein
MHEFGGSHLHRAPTGDGSNASHGFTSYQFSRHASAEKLTFEMSTPTAAVRSKQFRPIAGA